MRGHCIPCFRTPLDRGELRSSEGWTLCEQGSRRSRHPGSHPNSSGGADSAPHLAGPVSLALLASRTCDHSPDRSEHAGASTSACEGTLGWFDPHARTECGDDPRGSSFGSRTEYGEQAARRLSWPHMST